jgi:hypothetical protein
LLSYSKKPPKGGDALPEVFELALELIDFHGDFFPENSAGAGAPERARMLSPPLPL